MIHVCPECGFNEVIDCEEAAQNERDRIRASVDGLVALAHDADQSQSYARGYLQAFNDVLDILAPESTPKACTSRSVQRREAIQRESASDPKTCETCDHQYDGTCEDGRRPCARCALMPVSPRPVSAEDVEIIRSALNALAEIRRDIQVIEQYEEWSGGSPNYETCRTFGRIKDISSNSFKALAALDRIAGKDE